MSNFGSIRGGGEGDRLAALIEIRVFGLPSDITANIDIAPRSWINHSSSSEMWDHILMDMMDSPWRVRGSSPNLVLARGVWLLGDQLDLTFS